MVHCGACLVERIGVKSLHPVLKTWDSFTRNSVVWCSYFKLWGPVETALNPSKKLSLPVFCNSGKLAAHGNPSIFQLGRRWGQRVAELVSAGRQPGLSWILHQAPETSTRNQHQKPAPGTRNQHYVAAPETGRKWLKIIPMQPEEIFGGWDQMFKIIMLELLLLKLLANGYDACIWYPSLLTRFDWYFLHLIFWFYFLSTYSDFSMWHPRSRQSLTLMHSGCSTDYQVLMSTSFWQLWALGSMQKKPLNSTKTTWAD